MEQEQKDKLARNRRASRDRERLIQLTEYLPILKKFTMILGQIKQLEQKQKRSENK